METLDPSDFRALLAFNIKRLRAARGWTQEKLALEANISRSFINDIERQERNVSVDTVQKITKALGVRPVDMFFAG